MSIDQQALDGYESSLFRLGKSANTVRVYSNIVRQFMASEHSDFLDWIIEARNNGASASLLKSRTAAMKSWSDYLGLDAERKSLNEYKLPTVGAPTPHPVPGGVNIIRAAIAFATERETKLTLALGGLAGFRIAETLSVRPVDWNKSTNLITIRGKGGKTRHVPVSRELAQILTAYAPENPKSKYVNRQDRCARKKVTDLFGRMGVVHKNGKNVSSHDLRATFATEVYNGTGDIVKVQRLLGHSSVAQTQQYLGISDAAFHEAVNF
ncbi:putative integrase [Gordonia phage GMA3]|uniref:Integrase n=1 Tax=Gordonia phage GMA3 TaxID=1647284 RepID=A0A0K0NL26_9CAUD|nr:integrase [Gordonia phage GMA3]AKL88252.1 putative integrase [Gordonia phage GMA3]